MLEELVDHRSGLLGISGVGVSASDSLLTGNLTGNFSNLGLFLRFLLLINEQIQMLASKFPSKWNREFF
jgi:hypothetical protein